MRSFVAAAFVLANLAACGGHLDTGPDPDGGTCPSSLTGACSENGATCSTQASVCGHEQTETCTCTNGSWACPLHSCPKETCPVNPVQGGTCGTSGMSCPTSTISDCADIPVTCVCDGAHFQCPIIDCPPPLCPPPDQVVAGEACAGSTSQLCIDGTGSGCFCNGTWECEGVDGGVPDAGFESD